MIAQAIFSYNTLFLWLHMIKQAIKSIEPCLSVRPMLKEYLEQMSTPATRE
jgi:hypothetical protein